MKAAALRHSLAYDLATCVGVLLSTLERHPECATARSQLKLVTSEINRRRRMKPPLQPGSNTEAPPVAAPTP